MRVEVIATNLRRLRQQRGLTQERLAEVAGLSRLAYRNIETRKSVPRANTLHALAAALEVGVQELVAPVPHLQHVRFRSLKRLNSREQILAEVARRLADFNDLEKLLGEEKTRPWALRVRRGAERPLAAARAVRAHFGLDEREPVRDICGLLEANGFKVILTSVASDGFFGLSVSERDGGPAVVVNNWERISVERRIFTAAHELGHLLFHLSAYDINFTVEEKADEREANLFASHLLMPEGVFQDEWQETYGLPFLKRVFKVKRMFRVSYKTVLYRLAAHQPAVNYFAKFQSEYQRVFGVALGKAEEPEALGRDAVLAPEPHRAGEPEELFPSDFEEDGLFSLVRRAVEQELISLSRAAEILGKSLEEMRELSASWV